MSDFGKAFPQLFAAGANMAHDAAFEKRQREEYEEELSGIFSHRMLDFLKELKKGNLDLKPKDLGMKEAAKGRHLLCNPFIH